MGRRDMNLLQREATTIISSVLIAERLLSSRTPRLKPFRRGLPSVTVLRSHIISWNSTVDVRNVARRKRRPGEKVKVWSLAASAKPNRPELLKRK
jgi:hypothetical protein